MVLFDYLVLTLCLLGGIIVLRKQIDQKEINMIIEMVEEMQDGTQWTYIYTSCADGLYQTEDGEKYTKSEIEGFKKELQSRGILFSYSEKLK